MQITLDQWLVTNGYSTTDEALGDVEPDSAICPALCSAGCEVEPDGHCEHGAPSLLLALGLI